MGREVRLSGFEVWQSGANGLIAHSHGYFDSAAASKRPSQSQPGKRGM